MRPGQRMAYELEALFREERHRRNEQKKDNRRPPTGEWRAISPPSSVAAESCERCRGGRAYSPPFPGRAGGVGGRHKKNESHTKPYVCAIACVTGNELMADSSTAGSEK
jgi:hypothetical protein